jgi:hypothetical protein
MAQSTASNGEKVLLFFSKAQSSAFSFHGGITVHLNTTLSMPGSQFMITP